MNRDMYFFMARVANHIERYHDVIPYIKVIISLNAKLSKDERELLCYAHKAMTLSIRSTLCTLNVFLEDDTVKKIPERLEKVQSLHTKLIKKLSDLCSEMIQLIDSRLLPAADGEDSIVFYLKQKADNYRHSVEFSKDPMRKNMIAKAKEAYEAGIQIAKTNKYNISQDYYLNINLNYSVFLYEIMGQKKEAIDWAEQSFKDGLDEGWDCEVISSKADICLQMLKENASIWMEEQGFSH